MQIQQLRGTCRQEASLARQAGAVGAQPKQMHKHLVGRNGITIFVKLMHMRSSWVNIYVEAQESLSDQT